MSKEFNLADWKTTGKRERDPLTGRTIDFVTMDWHTAELKRFAEEVRSTVEFDHVHQWYAVPIHDIDTILARFVGEEAKEEG